MEPHHLKLVETTIQFLQFMTSIFAIVLTATGAIFYYYWTTNKFNIIKIKDLWMFMIPTGIVLGFFIFAGILYSKAIEGMAEGTIVKYMDFWFKWVGLFLGMALFFSIVSLALAFVLTHEKVTKN